MKRPRIRVARQPLDSYLEVIGLVGLVIMVTIPLYSLSTLPETIPVHFGFDGTPDRFGSRTSILTLPIIGSLLFILLAVLCRYPHIFNYPVAITEENAYDQYQKATRLLRIFNVIIAFSFAYISYVVVQNALGNTEGLSTNLIMIFIVFTLVIPLVYLLIMSGRPNHRQKQ